MSARGLIQSRGAKIVFVYDGIVHTASTDATTPDRSKVIGAAMRVPGDPKRLEELQLTEAETISLQFTPDTIGEVPPLEAECTWGLHKYRVRDVQPVAPNGVAQRARVIITK